MANKRRNTWLLLPPASRSNRCFGIASSTRRSQPRCRSSGPAATSVPRRGCRRSMPQLRGGVPRGQVSEIVGPRSSGRTSVLRALMAEATRRGELVALIDTLDRFDPASAAAAGVDLARAPVGARAGRAVDADWRLRPDGSPPGRDPAARATASSHGRSTAPSRPSTSCSSRAGSASWRSTSPTCRSTSLRELPFNTWMRLQRVVDASDTACVLVADVPSARSTKGVSIRLQPQRSSARRRGRAVTPRLRHVTARTARDAPVRHPVPACWPAGATAMPSREGLAPGRVSRGGARQPPPVRAAHDQPRRDGRWAGTASPLPRLRGLAADASVVRAQHHAHATTSVAPRVRRLSETDALTRTRRKAGGLRLDSRK